VTGVTGSVYVGVSGFSYPRWRGKFYPKEAKSEELLAQYAQRLKSVEINSSFYAAPKPSAVEGWAEKTGKDFRFSFKAPQLITHILKLGEGSSEAAGRLSETLDLLGPRRGPVLFQLPPYMKQDLKLLDGFLSKTSGIERRVFEFRHKSWLDGPTYRMLDEHETGFCIAETEEMKPTFKVTGGFAYLRLRLDSYDTEAIDRWAKKVGEVAQGSEACYVYLRHDEIGENALLAQRLSKKLQGSA
jgi:uncharacterized protein YecE (DUF72 family)